MKRVLFLITLLSSAFLVNCGDKGSNSSNNYYDRYGYSDRYDYWNDPNVRRNGGIPAYNAQTGCGFNSVYQVVQYTDGTFACLPNSYISAYNTQYFYTYSAHPVIYTNDYGVQYYRAGRSSECSGEDAILRAAFGAGIAKWGFDGSPWAGAAVGAATCLF
ncbi:MAG: hypothetical protein KDD50_03025 [Bdellovibrionales bacterium]|nr:hypothetical protein [Bdellovibrionales bacterium]